jgi:general secretion pathway protein D
MRSRTGFAFFILLLLSCLGRADTSSKAELRAHKKSHEVYLEAMELVRSGNLDRGRDLLDRALALDAGNAAALTARELLRQQNVQQRLRAGNQRLGQGEQQLAIADFRQALKLDPKNAQAQLALRDALTQQFPEANRKAEIRYRDAGEVELAPSIASHDFHYRGDTRGLLQQVWSAYGIKPLIDSSVNSNRVRFDLDGADFATATTIASQMTKTFYAVIDAHQALIVSDTPENRKQFERLALRTFYISESGSAQELNDVVTMLRSIFEFRFVTPAASSNQVTVRAPLEQLEAATRILEDLYNGKPQIVLELNVYQVERTLARDLGLGLPNQFTLFNVNTEAQKLLSAGNQDLVNQLISSGAINQANSSSIAALLAGLAAGGGQGSILNQPIATFGGGITRSGVIIPGANAHLSLNKSSFQQLDHVLLRAAQNDPASFRDGTRFPVINASFSPISNSSAISRVLGNQSFIAPVPSFTYEDIGLGLKATPNIHANDVALKLEFQLRGLGAQTLNGVPVISNREYNGNIDVPFGETAILAGMISRQEQLSLQGVAGLAQLPILGGATSLRNKQTDDQELLITISPHLVRGSFHDPEAGTAFLPPGKSR